MGAVSIQMLQLLGYVFSLFGRSHRGRKKRRNERQHYKREQEEQRRRGQEGGTRDPLGKWHPWLFRGPRLCLRVWWVASWRPDSLCAGRPPCKQGKVFALASIGLLELCRFGWPEKGAPCKEGESPGLCSPGGEWSSLRPPCKQGRAFSAVLCAPGQCDPL